MLKKIVENIYLKYNQKTFRKEDEVVFGFLKRLSSGGKKINYLEVGSGLCRFPLIIKDKYKNFSIKCLEKNNDLVEAGRRKGLDVFCGDITGMEFGDEEFDIIHCSHVIEHLSYEGIVKALGEMLRILKPNGYLLIRSPLMHPGFYFDLDHIRPYPPEAILNYFRSEQQQKVGEYSVLEIARWYRKEAPLIYNSGGNMTKLVNLLLKIFWLTIGFPKWGPNGYVLILKKV